MKNNARGANNWLRYFIPCPSFAEQTMKLATKQSEDGSMLASEEPKSILFPDTAHAKEGGFFKENPHKVLFPDSELFKKWGRDLSEAQQKEAEDLFQKFGYNVCLQ